MLCPSSPSSANATSAPAPLVLRRRPSRQHLRFGSGKYSLFLSQFLPIQFKQSHFLGAWWNMSSMCKLVIKFRYFQSTMGAVQLNRLVVKMNVISRRAVVERPVGSSVAQVVLRAAPMLALDHPLMATRTTPFNGQIYFLGGKKAKVVIHISKSTRTFCLQPPALRLQLNPYQLTAVCSQFQLILEISIFSPRDKNTLQKRS